MRTIPPLPALLVSTLLMSLPAGATECPEPTGASPALRRIDSEARLRFIQERLRRDAARAGLWTNAWTGGYALLTAGQVAVGSFLSPSDQVDLYVGAASSAGGVVLMLATPLDVMADSPALDARVRSQAGQDTCAVLAEAERLLAKDASNEADGAGWLMQGANVAYNLLTAVVLGVFFNHWESGAINAAAGWAVGEVMILTQPTHLVEDLRQYREGKLEPGAPVSLRWGIGPNPGARGYGLSLTLNF